MMCSEFEDFAADLSAFFAERISRQFECRCDETAFASADQHRASPPGTRQSRDRCRMNPVRPVATKCIGRGCNSRGRCPKIGFIEAEKGVVAAFAKGLRGDLERGYLVSTTQG